MNRYYVNILLNAVGGECEQKARGGKNECRSSLYQRLSSRGLLIWSSIRKVFLTQMEGLKAQNGWFILSPP